MRLITEVLWGRRRGACSVITAGQALTIGSSSRAGLSLPHDKKLAGLHLTLRWDGHGCQLESRRGVLLAGDKAKSGEVAHGSWIRAGETDLLVSYEGVTSALYREQREYEQPECDHGELDDHGVSAALVELGDSVGELYAVVDASRDSIILAILREHVDRRSCLYQGEQAVSMYDVAPYLVKFRADSRLLERLVTEGWGKRWACYFRSPKRFKDVRTQLRRFLIVQEETSQDNLYFRFYDPRVMRIFTSLITPRQRALLYGKGTLPEVLFEEGRQEECSYAQLPYGSLVRVSLLC